VRITLLAALLLALAGCGGKSASNEAFDEAVTVAENSTVALGKADCSNLLVKGEVSDGWAEPPPVSSLPPDQRTAEDVLAAARKNAEGFTADSRAGYLAGCRDALP
jgi:hypothetical protein